MQADRQTDMTKLMSHFLKFCEMCLTILPLLSNNDRRSVSTYWNPIQIQHIATCNGNQMIRSALPITQLRPLSNSHGAVMS
jgi:hypothetical protein